MVFQAALVDITNDTDADRLSHQSNVNSKDSNPTKPFLSNATTACKDTPSAKSDEIACDNSHHVNRSSKKLKVAKNRAIAISRNNNDLTARTLIQSLQVWQYTVHCSNFRFSICCLCPNDKEISINNGSTSTLRKHSITKHQLHELALPSKKCKRVTSSFDSNKK